MFSQYCKTKKIRFLYHFFIKDFEIFWKFIDFFYGLFWIFRKFLEVKKNSRSKVTRVAHYKFRLAPKNNWSMKKKHPVVGFISWLLNYTGRATILGLTPGWISFKSRDCCRQLCFQSDHVVIRSNPVVAGVEGEMLSRCSPNSSCQH